MHFIFAHLQYIKISGHVEGLGGQAQAYSCVGAPECLAAQYKYMPQSWHVSQGFS